MREPADELRALEAQGLRRRLRNLTGLQQPQTELDGRTLVNFSSNDYLGLASRPELQQVFREAVDQYGAGSGASRLVCGGLPPHRHLETVLAAAKGTEAALAFSSGYATAVGTLSGLLEKGDVVILDKLSHASLIDGARLSGATLRIFPHNNTAKLQALLQWAVGHTDATTGRIVVVTESIFSMDGDQAPLREIAQLAKSYGAWLLVDEAHAFGLFGVTGGGLVKELGLESLVDLQMGTLSKALGLSGGFVAARREIIELLVNKARSFIYSTAPPPAVAAAAAWVVEQWLPSAAGQTARKVLWEHVRQFSAFLGLEHASSAILPMVLGETEKALAASERLLAAGFLVPAIRYPTVAKNSARLRITLSAHHTAEQREQLQTALAALA
jgi:8-amino-7-oxononanoate synthase